MNYNIPLVDFAKCGLLISESDVTEQDLRDAGDELYLALSTAGFVYLTNHGIPWSKVDELNEIAEKFYSLPLQTKKQFEQDGFALSYDSIGRSKLNLKDVDDYEGFRTSGEAYLDDGKVLWPDVPGLKKSHIDFGDIVSKLLLRILKALGLGMKLKNKEYFCQVHSLMNKPGNISIVKTVRYPPIHEGDPSTKLRFAEHTDKTTLTVLFQDSSGGLKARNATDKLVNVDPVPGAIVLNVGDTLEAWSGNRLKATRHLVDTPTDPEKKAQVRRSIAYFAQANNGVLMEKLDFDDEEEADQADPGDLPLTVEEFVYNRLKEFYDRS